MKTVKAVLYCRNSDRDLFDFVKGQAESRGFSLSRRNIEKFGRDQREPFDLVFFPADAKQRQLIESVYGGNCAKLCPISETTAPHPPKAEDLEVEVETEGLSPLGIFLEGQRLIYHRTPWHPKTPQDVPLRPVLAEGPDAPAMFGRHPYPIALTLDRYTEILRTSKVNMLATQRQYLDHLLPVWKALPEEVRGRFFVPEKPSSLTRGEDILAYYAIGGEDIPGLETFDGVYPAIEETFVVSSYGDLRGLLNRGDRPVCLAEHGIGRFIPEALTPACPGGTGLRAFVGLFLTPNQQAVDRNLATYPEARCRAIGVPKLDRWHSAPKKRKGNPPVVAITSHWDCSMCDWTRSAWMRFKPAFLELTERYQVLGTGHPRIIDQLIPHYERLGIQWTKELQDVFEHADLLIGDFTSAMDEFASLGRPVVRILPDNGEKANEGALFGGDHPGIAVFSPSDLPSAVAVSLRGGKTLTEQRNKSVEASMTFRDGKCSERAAAEIMAWRKEG